MVSRRVLRAACLSLIGISGAAVNILAPHGSVAYAQSAPTATLVADSVAFDGTSLRAVGHVEIFYGDVHLTSGAIRYDRASGALSIEGPIRLSDPEGKTVIYAQAAQLDADLRNGILTSARLVIDQQLQLASTQIDVVDGRYTQLSNTVTSACKVCAANPIPLWEIRARSVIHDNQDRQVYFTDAQFRVAGVPIAYLPHLRLPDPTLKRATGFIIPSLHNSTTLGWGAEIPYFIKLGDHRDLTLAPFVSSETRTLKLGYRQAFVTGDLTVQSAVTSDAISDGLRGYIFANGAWDVAGGYTLGVDLRLTSDISYLIDYDIYSGDRLKSNATVSRFDADSGFDAAIITSRSLRESEISIKDTIPFVLGEATYSQSTEFDRLPGTLTYGLSASGFLRRSDVDTALSTTAGGMDVLRLGGSLGWAHSLITQSGVRLKADAGLDLNLYTIRQNSDYDTATARVTPQTSALISYPLVRTTAGGARQIVEPFAQLGWAQTYGGDIPNSDSTLLELDEGNMLNLTRFPGYDRSGSGASSAVGLRFTSMAPTAQYGLTVGRVEEINPSDTTSLLGSGVNWVVGGFATFDTGFDVVSRGIFDASLDLSSWETRFGLSRDGYSVSGTHAYGIADTGAGREADINELRLESGVKLSSYWSAEADLRHDLIDNLTNSAGLGLTFQNECTKVELGVSHRYTDTAALDPDTTYSLKIGFGAFGDTGKRARRSCGVMP
ncbi:MAG: LPS assembly protein LptD [Celeribacter marinus]